MIEESDVLNLMCFVKQFTVNYETHEVEVIVPESHCADMHNTIRLFEALDPAVHTISFYQENKPDTLYQKDVNYKWHAYRRD
jgi:hypothetical protein